MRFEVLGFAAGAALQAACSSYLVASERTTLLLDCGPGALERLWRRDLLARLDAVVLSHMHADHVLDVLSLASDAVAWVRGERRLALYVPAGDGRAVLGRLAAVFDPPGEDGTRFDRRLVVHEYGADAALAVGDLALRFAQTAHPGPCFATRVTDGRAVIVYGADGAASDATVALGRDADLLVLEATDAVLAQARATFAGPVDVAREGLEVAL